MMKSGMLGINKGSNSENTRIKKEANGTENGNAEETSNTRPSTAYKRPNVSSKVGTLGSKVRSDSKESQKGSTG
jgi:hypothetical protein